LGASIAVLAYVATLDWRVVHGFGAGRWRHPIAVYAAPRVIERGLDVDRAEIPAELARLGYRPVEGVPAVPGTYRRGARSLEIFLRGRATAGGFASEPPEKVILGLDGGRVESIASGPRGERPAERLVLDPPLLEGLFADQWSPRAPLDLDQVPQRVVDAVLAAEDARFMSHFGVDPNALARAVQVNWRAQALRQGGSTITQQVVKNYFLTQRRSFVRKLNEALMAMLLELHFSKREILEAYLQNVYLGHDHLLGVYGFAEGARAYFDKPLSDLTLGEAATLAGIIRAPNIYSPLRHRARALARRDQVLAQLESLDWISPEEATRARAERPVRPRRRPAAAEAWLVQEARRELEGRGLAPGRLDLGSAVFTTLDLRLEGIVDEEVERAVRTIERSDAARRGVEVAVVAIDPATGAIRALCGGRDFLRSQLDRATQVERPVGSLFKPFVYLAAIADPELRVTPATVLRDEPVSVQVDHVAWQPQNYDQRFRGPVTLRYALEHSLNVPTVQLAQWIGIDSIARFGDRLGLTAGGEPLPRVPSLSLGTFSASLLRVGAAYTLFARGGSRVTPHAVEAVRAPSGVALWEPGAAPVEVAGEAPVYVVHSLLAGVVDRGTARAVREAGLHGALAGKTGTTSDFRDAWFVGYAPSLVVAIWLGFDDDRPLNASAAEVAVPLWTAIMRRALAGAPARSFRIPPDVDLVRIEAATGKLAGPGCGPPITEAFVHGTTPTVACQPGAALRATASEGPGQGSPARADGTLHDILMAVPKALRALIAGIGGAGDARVPDDESGPRSEAERPLEGERGEPR
ncbi:MAG TPA: PBP1A family penicillin-binding protein, partial [Candidatus Bathyarchaeia archaeon]|nr:PBP1A family penicillin-binding protein [Candidatus Bathyarchaeia archaeon]